MRTTAIVLAEFHILTSFIIYLSAINDKIVNFPQHNVEWILLHTKVWTRSPNIERIPWECTVGCTTTALVCGQITWMWKCAEGDAQSHFIKINKKFVFFPENLSNLEAYNRVWTRGTLQTDRVNSYTICTVQCKHVWINIQLFKYDRFTFADVLATSTPIDPGLVGLHLSLNSVEGIANVMPASVSPYTGAHNN